jgi:hypothetical protein
MTRDGSVLILFSSLVVADVVLASISPAAQTSDLVSMWAGRVIDGRGQATSNHTITIRGSQIVAVEPSKGAVTYDLGNLTLLPGFIDTHVHIGWHCGRAADGRRAAAARPSWMVPRTHPNDTPPPVTGRPRCLNPRAPLSRTCCGKTLYTEPTPTAVAFPGGARC